MMKIAIAGCTGRMGISLVQLLASSRDCRLAGGSYLPGADEAEQRALLARLGASDIFLTTEAAALVAHADAVIDFTSPAHTLAIADAVAKEGKVHIIGTTGMSAAQLEQLRAFSDRARIVQSGNFSLGVNVLEALVEKAAALLSDAYDVEVDEMHHALKKDAPSGTALMLGRALAKGRGVEFEKARTHYGEGELGERKRGTIGMSVRRGGEVVGVHTVTFAGPGENLELTHRGFSRDIYAHGAIKAAKWAAAQKPGFYSMRDVLAI